MGHVSGGRPVPATGTGVSTPTLILATLCPSCRRRLNATSTPPRPGLVTICAYCVAPLRFGAELELELVELEALDPNEADTVRAAVDTMRRRLAAMRSRWN